MPTVNASYFSGLTTSYHTAHPPQPEPAGRFDFVGAWSSASDWRKAGEYGGLTVGCAVGGAATLGDPIGCGVAAISVTLITMPTFTAIGFVLGGLHASGADAFEGLPDETTIFDGLLE